MEYCFLHGSENDFAFRDVVDPSEFLWFQSLSQVDEG